MSSQSVTLTVEEAYRSDRPGRKIVRISDSTMRKLGIETGDFVLIKSPKAIEVGVAWPLRGEGEEVIRMDGHMRQVLGVSVGDKVEVMRADNLKPARRIELAPVGQATVPTFFGAVPINMVVSPDDLRDELVRRPLIRGDLIPLSDEIQLAVVDTNPTDPIYVTDDTEVRIRSEPVKPSEYPLLSRGTRVTWEDIGDLEEAKQRIREIVELPMKHPEIFQRLGIEPPKGILIYGPPGVGKTLLAKALANEIGAYFVAINGPEIMSKFYGESEERLREVFKEAQENAPSIVFIDEIDSIAPKREEVTGEVEKRVVAQLLTLMDGIQERGKVIVIGATNRPDDVDPALRRPGRFDREIEIRPPDKQGRLEILQVHTRSMPLDSDVNLAEIADLTKGYTGADLAALAKEAAMAAVREFMNTGKVDLSKPGEIKKEVLETLKVSRRHFLEAMKVVRPTLIREVFVEVPEVHWSDIGGLESAKQELREVVEWPLKYSDVFQKMGVEPPKGVLLFGPPGTGKTLLAKAVATESGANFIAIRGPEVLSKWVGESEKAIRDVFRRAREVAPVVVFFDEIDAIAPARGYSFDSGVTDRIVNQLLTEMDGLVPLNNVVVLAATNRPDIVDPALMRPGRFDRIIYVPPPDKDSRKQIFQVHLRKVPLANDVDIDRLADLTEGYTGADIAAVVREAVFAKLREKLEPGPVEWRHFQQALKKVKPSLTREDVARYEQMGDRLKKLVLST
ncbi:CDC48 family AAA ATPase [Acidilobus sp. 7A]|jgi:transitional endoplasmic reticulum ATPase|uniref:CDC48 family AAA ATPase n=1 Tax=Acidilobus sp. 7A TaxID=1577685 RepID=UPI000764DA2A|nr:CDC48 family AAA ATPase [Acidilobus sp. 7A]AMD31064.1 ATPase AAA [Acidilobus sp. 7A]